MRTVMCERRATGGEDDIIAAVISVIHPQCAHG